MNIKGILGRLVDLRSPNAFNPYAERCKIADLPDGAAIRLHNLELVLREAAQGGVDEVWVALEPTYKGARRTGLAMTDEQHLQAHGRMFGIEGLRLATRPPGPNEDTASVVWGALENINRRVFLWNTVPLHTHKPDQPFSLRRHNAAERRASAPILEAILDLLGPSRLVGVGYEASKALGNAGRPHDSVRHPARGGTARFTQQVSGSPPV